MSDLAVKQDFGAIEAILIQGDLNRLSSEQSVQYYQKVCETLGLNPLTRPFDYITLQGKRVLYANKGCAEQLRMVHKISIRITNRETINDVYVVTVEATARDGRTDGATGAVSIKGLQGLDLANAFLKCETKAKRRVTLSVCGLNMLDETEVEGIPEKPPVAPAKIISEVTPEPEAKRTRSELIAAIMSTAQQINCSREELGNWATDLFKKPTNKLSEEELEQFLDVLSKEITEEAEV